LGKWSSDFVLVFVYFGLEQICKLFAGIMMAWIWYLLDYACFYSLYFCCYFSWFQLLAWLCFKWI